MTDFNALLDQVLAQDANVPVPNGLEQRIFSRVSSSQLATTRRRSIWSTAAAASILAYFAAWHFHQTPPSSPAIQRATSTPASAAPLIAPTSAALAVCLPQAVKVSVPRHRTSPKAVPSLSIDPIVIQPVTIQPIEFASLSVDNSPIHATKKGLVQ